jgi:hypothetical protein
MPVVLVTHLCRSDETSIKTFIARYITGSWEVRSTTPNGDCTRK